MRVASGLILGLAATFLGAPHAVLFSGLVIVLLVLATAGVKRSLWQADLRHDKLRAAKNAVNAVES